MKKLLSGTLLILLGVLSNANISKASEESIIEESDQERFVRLVLEYPSEIFIGNWCGQWDEIFNVCFDVRFDEATGQYTAIYQWEEEKGLPYESMELKGGRTNLNTLVFDGFIIMSILKPESEEQQNTARVLGLFEERSRLATMELTDS